MALPSLFAVATDNYIDVGTGMTPLVRSHRLARRLGLNKLYIKNDAVCKSKQLLSYFGETNITPCGICSVCTKTKKPTKSQDLKSLRNHIIERLESGDLSSRALITELNCSEKDLKMVLQLLLEHQIISITKTNTYKLFHR